MTDDYFKVVYIKNTKEVEPIPHQWEQNGIVYWPPTKGEVRKQQSNADSVPDKKKWNKYDCLVKATNILLYMHASAQADLLCTVEDSTTDDDEKGKIVPAKPYNNINKRTTVLKKNAAGLPKSLPAYDFDLVKEKEKLASTNKKQKIVVREDPETSMSLTNSSVAEISDIDTTIVNDSDAVLERLTILEAKMDDLCKNLKECNAKILEKIVEKFADISVRINNLEVVLKKAESSLSIPDNELQIFPVDTVPALEKLERDLEDKSFKKKVFSHLIRCIGSAMQHKAACYKLSGVIFTKNLLTKYSWTGMSRGMEKKAFNKLTGILDVFYRVVFKSDNSFTYPLRDSFFRDCILKHSKTRFNKTIKNLNSEILEETIEKPQEHEEMDNSVQNIDYEIFNVGVDGELLMEDQNE